MDLLQVALTFILGVLKSFLSCYVNSYTTGFTSKVQVYYRCLSKSSAAAERRQTVKIFLYHASYKMNFCVTTYLKTEYQLFCLKT